jgi:hypothetical protein
MSRFVTARGTELTFDGRPLRLRGFGVGTWLNMEHFMLSVPTPDGMIRKTWLEVYGEARAEAFFSRFEDGFFSEADCRYLKRIGVNFLRVPFNYRLLVDDQTGEYLERGFMLLTRLMDLCERNEIFCMPDLHAAPGGQNPDWHSDNRTGVPEFWAFGVFRRQAAKLWGEIARRLKGYEYLMGYDLLNEPAMARWDALNGFYREAVAEIRKHDPFHAVVLEGDHFAMDFSGLERFDVPNLVLSFHYYPTVWHPDLLARDLPRAERYEKLEEGLVRLAAIREAFGCPVVCGEAGYDLDPGDMGFSMDLLSDTLEIFEKHQVPWAIWAYKDTCFMGITHPSADSPWMRFAGEIKKRWGHYREMEEARGIVDFLAKPYGGIPEELAYRAQFRVRGILYELQKERILLPLLREIPWEQMRALPDSFLFENCAPHPEYEALIRSFCSKP